MKLAQLFETMQPFLEGRLPLDAASAQLFGEAAQGREAERLALYPQNYLQNVLACASKVFPITQNSVTALYGAHAWHELMSAYAVKFPMPEVAFGTLHLPEFIRDSGHLAPWLAELADVEQWERRISVALDAAPAPEGTELSLADPLELRDYEYQVLPWMAHADPERPPRLRFNVVAFWRPGSSVKRRILGPAAMSILRAVSRGSTASELRAEETFDQLVRVGLVRITSRG